MKRKGKSSSEKDRETCNVWLDTSVLKRHKKQILPWKPLRVAEQLFPCSMTRNLPGLHTKQTTISRFFGVQREEKSFSEKILLEANSNSMTKGENHTLPRLTRNSPPVSPLRTRIVQEHSQQPSHNPQSLSFSPYSFACGRATNNSHFPFYIKETSGVTDRGNRLLDFHQVMGEKKAPDTVSSSPLRNGNRDGKSIITREHLSHQNLKTLPKKRIKVQGEYRHLFSCGDGSFMESSDSENISPQLETNPAQLRQWRSCHNPASDLGLESNTTICNAGKSQQNNQENALSAEDHHVISPHCLQEREAISLQNRLPCKKSNLLMSSSYKHSRGACNSAESSSHLAAGASLSVQADSQESSCDMLFTEDSEGNKVIKH